MVIVKIRLKTTKKALGTVPELCMVSAQKHLALFVVTVVMIDLHV